MSEKRFGRMNAGNPLHRSRRDLGRGTEVADDLDTKTPHGLLACAKDMKDTDLIKLAESYVADMDQLDRNTDHVIRQNLEKDRSRLVTGIREARKKRAAKRQQ